MHPVDWFTYFVPIKISVLMWRVSLWRTYFTGTIKELKCTMQALVEITMTFKDLISSTSFSTLEFPSANLFHHLCRWKWNYILLPINLSMGVISYLELLGEIIKRNQKTYPFLVFLFFCRSFYTSTIIRNSPKLEG